MLKESLNKWLKIDPVEIIREVLEEDKTQTLIEDQNRDQLRDGENSEDVKLSAIGGEYSDLTLKLHPEKVRDKVNLFDTGEFYKSIDVKLNNDLFEIDANPIKIDENGNRTNLFDRWGEDILGLDDENLQKTIDILKDGLIEGILQKV